MMAQTYLQIARNKFSVSFLSDYPTTPYLLSTLYSLPFSVNLIANPLGEVCPAHVKDFSSIHDRDYEKWADSEKNVLFKYWMKSEFGNDFTNLQDNCVYFQTDSYVIRTCKNRPETGVRLPLPQTLDDFISDCNRVGVELYWKDEVVKKTFQIMNIGRAIKRLRIERGVSQIRLGSKCKISQTSLSQIETGYKRPHERNLKKICKALKISQVGIYILSIEASDIRKDKLELYKTIRPVLTKIFM